MKTNPISSSPLPVDAVAVESTALAKIAHDTERAILLVEFRNGTLYQYRKVPRQIYQDLLRADSKGVYFNRHIRNLFQHTILAAAAPTPSG